MSNYEQIIKFGNEGPIDVANSEINDPLTYCLGDNMNQKFLHGSHSDSYGQHSRSCQLYFQNKCTDEWDDVCEIASRDTTTSYPNNVNFGCTSSFEKYSMLGQTAGDILVHNTAKEKYISETKGCVLKREPFDPLVPSSPYIHYWDKSHCGNTCDIRYEIDPSVIDNDPVMNKILAKPTIALDVLINIYNNMKRQGTLTKLKSTKIGFFYNVHPYFKNLGGLN